jgi:hypothetical protein
MTGVRDLLRRVDKLKQAAVYVPPPIPSVLVPLHYAPGVAGQLAALNAVKAWRVGPVESIEALPTWVEVQRDERESAPAFERRAVDVLGEGPVYFHGPMAPQDGFDFDDLSLDQLRELAGIPAWTRAVLEPDCGEGDVLEADRDEADALVHFMADARTESSAPDPDQSSQLAAVPPSAMTTEPTVAEIYMARRVR